MRFINLCGLLIYAVYLCGLFVYAVYLSMDLFSFPVQLLREQIARHRVGTTDEGMDTRHFPAHEREDLVKLLETDRDKVRGSDSQLQTDILNLSTWLWFRLDIYDWNPGMLDLMMSSSLKISTFLKI